MKKLIIAAALVAATVAVPTLPVQAQPMLPEVSENCRILPMLKRECWEEARGAWEAGPPAIAMAAAPAPMIAPPPPPSMPAPPSCTRAPAGSGYLFDC